MHITFYDLDGERRPWSVNTLVTRACLNHKKLPFETKWLKYPEIEPTCKSIGLTKWHDPPPDFTVPSVRIQHDDGTVEAIMGTAEIATRLDALQAELPLRVKESPDWLPANRKLLKDIQFHVIYNIGEYVLKPQDKDNAEWFFETRKVWTKGRHLSDWAAVPPEHQTPEAHKERLSALKELLAQHDGPFILGDQPCFADFKVGGVLAWIDVADPPLFAKILEQGPEVRAYYERLRPYWPELPRHGTATGGKL